MITTPVVTQSLCDHSPLVTISYTLSLSLTRSLRDKQFTEHKIILVFSFQYHKVNNNMPSNAIYTHTSNTFVHIHTCM